MEQIYGYARVSTKEQNEARQLTALREMGIRLKMYISISSRGQTSNVCSIGGCCGGWGQATR